MRFGAGHRAAILVSDRFVRETNTQIDKSSGNTHFIDSPVRNAYRTLSPEVNSLGCLKALFPDIRKIHCFYRHGKQSGNATVDNADARTLKKIGEEDQRQFRRAIFALGRIFMVGSIIIR